MKSYLFAGLGFAVGLSASAALAQPAAAPAGPPPGVSTKVIQDWTINCTSAASQTPCEMVQGVEEKKTGQPLLTVSIIYIPARDQNVMVLRVPLGVAIPQGLVLKTDAFTSPKMPYHHCDRNGCYVEVPIDKGTLGTMGHTANGVVQIVADGGKALNVKISLNGFAEASDTLVELAKQKAKTPPPAQPAQSAPAVIK